MRIESAFKDFYDHADFGWRDGTIFYDREMTNISFDQKSRAGRSTFFVDVYNGSRIGRNLVRTGHIFRTGVSIAGIFHRFYFREGFEPSKDPKDLLQADEGFMREWWASGGLNETVNIRNFGFGNHLDYWKDGDECDLNDSHKSPVVLLGFDAFYQLHNLVWSFSKVAVDRNPRKGHGVINPNLSSLGLSRVFDASTVYRDIEAWLSLRSDKPMVEVSNETKIVKAGFDKKTSFRGKD